MGLYLCVFEADDVDNELEGVEVGGYDDLARFRETVCDRLEQGKWGSRFPTLMSHPDADGYWTTTECRKLRAEIRVIVDEFARLPPDPFPEGWQHAVAESLGLRPATLADSFIDVDGEALLGRLDQLAEVAIDADQRIWFQ